MPRINFSRTERFAQMSKQEQLIAQKRQQILEKQRTLELAKQIAAEATKETPSPGSEQMFKFDIPPPSLLPTLPPPPPPPPPPQLPAMADDVHFEPFYDLPPVVVIDSSSTAEDTGRPAGELELAHSQEHDKLPTTVEELIQLVADIGDVYEDKLCSRKNDLHPSLWFVFDRLSEAYAGFRRMIAARRAAREPDTGASGSTRRLEAVGAARPTEQDDAKYDPADVLDDSIIDEGGRDGQEVATTTAIGNSNEVPIHMMPNFYGDERHFYDDKSTTETDSDTEYVREARERNLKNLKRKTFDAGNRREDGSSTDSDDDYHGGLGDSANESMNEKNGASSGAGGGSATGGSGGGGGGGTGSGSRGGHRQKFRKKSRWGEGATDGTGTAGSQQDGAMAGAAPHQQQGAPWSVTPGQTNAPPPPPPPPLPAVTAPARSTVPLDRNDPGLLQYVFHHFGTVADVSPECWTKAEEHYRLQLLYDDLTLKVQEHDRFIRGASGEQHLDSDEERRLNTAKLEAIMRWISEITHLYERVRPGHLSEFLMRNDYERFVEQFRRTSDRQPNFDDYKEFRLREANGTLGQAGMGSSRPDGGSGRTEYSSTDSDFVSYREQTSSQQQQQPQGNDGRTESRTVEPSSTVGGGAGTKRAADPMTEQQQQHSAAKKRKSRWGDQVDSQTPGQSTRTQPPPPPPPLVLPPGPPPPLPPTPKLSTVSRTDPALLAYARQNFGSTNLSEEDWKKAEDHYKINLLYQDMLRKRQEIDRLANSGRFKYEYDSDEDTTGGTWEHKLRLQEMEATQKWANELTRQSEGKHHIGDFLPPEELRKFMEKYEAQKNNRQPNLSDYKDYKLREDNVGFQMLQKLGWKQGQGLGADGSGIVDPINKAAQRDNNQGLGIITPDNPEVNDNEYDAYRKRMMLAYRFRPNPL
uniref:G-patch domain-containing protein n=1 Tax=Anopheles dirus TaxID=7168 RepID=A0A182N596_9DIPT